MRLSRETAPALGYDRPLVAPGIVHLGVGAFHRAHQAPVFDALLRAGDRRWGVAAVAMRSPGVVAALDAQDGLYSLAERDGAALAPRVIGAIVATMIAAQAPERVVTQLAAAGTHMATLTVTEKGYVLPDGDVTATAPGLLALALDQRRREGRAPLTIMSCDNRSGNGAATCRAVLAAGMRLDLPDATLAWIEREVAFPSTMVDRITPATTDAMIAQSAAALGLEDQAAVWTEPFWQWVVEDRFAGARPDLAAHGVQIVADVAPWEDAKLRLLNAAHSTLAYHGLLSGHEFVHQAIADPTLRALIEAVWDEAGATLDTTVVDLSAYRSALLTRFANPALPHALIQIAADGSQKLPPRILATMLARHPEPSPALARAAAGWLSALGTRLPLADPLLDELRPLARAGDVAALLDRIGADIRLASAITAAR